MRIGILLTNNDDSAFARPFPNDGLKVANLLRPLRPSWSYEVIDVKAGSLPAQISDFDAYVITGSPASVNDESLPWIRGFLAWIREAHTRQSSIVGLCFGHQAVAKALGGEVQRNPRGWGLGTAVTQWPSPAPWMLPSMNATTLMAAHNEQVTRMPEQAVCLGGSDFCPFASMQVGENIWTTQYHPEMPLDFMQVLLEHLSGKLDSSTIEHARGSLRNIADASIFAQWMVNFIESRKANKS